jgi:hypothetical protein
MIWLSEELHTLRAEPYTTVICINDIGLLLVINHPSPEALTVNGIQRYDATLS